MIFYAIANIVFVITAAARSDTLYRVEFDVRESGYSNGLWCDEMRATARLINPHSSASKEEFLLATIKSPATLGFIYRLDFRPHIPGKWSLRVICRLRFAVPEIQRKKIGDLWRRNAVQKESTLRAVRRKLRGHMDPDQLAAYVNATEFFERINSKIFSAQFWNHSTEFLVFESAEFTVDVFDHDVNPTGLLQDITPYTDPEFKRESLRMLVDSCPFPADDLDRRVTETTHLLAADGQYYPEPELQDRPRSVRDKTYEELTVFILSPNLYRKCQNLIKDSSPENPQPLPSTTKVVYVPVAQLNYPFVSTAVSGDLDILLRLYSEVSNPALPISRLTTTLPRPSTAIILSRYLHKNSAETSLEVPQTLSALSKAVGGGIMLFIITFFWLVGLSFGMILCTVLAVIKPSLGELCKTLVRKFTSFDPFRVTGHAVRQLRHQISLSRRNRRYSSAERFDDNNHQDTD
jgi:hypothetical protein